MPTQSPLKVLQDARDRVLADSPFNISAYMVLCSAIGHVIGLRVSSVEIGDFCRNWNEMLEVK
jgi:hypothetical protein